MYLFAVGHTVWWLNRISDACCACECHHRFLLKHQEDIGDAAHQSIQDLALIRPEKSAQLVVLEPHTPTLLAYEKLCGAGVTGAPIISQQGQIIANLSLSDIRYDTYGLA